MSVIIRFGLIRTRMLFRVLLVLCCLLSSQFTFAAETIRITTGEWEPFLSEKYKNGGVLLDIVVKAFRRKGIEVEYEFMPWARAVKLVDDGLWDAMAVTGSRYSSADVDHIYSDPIYVGQDVLFYRKDTDLNWKSFKDLYGQKFGTVLSYDYSDEFRAAASRGDIKTVEAPEPDLLFPMLAAKRFDVFIMDKQAGLYTYNKKYRDLLGDAITYSSNPLYSLPYSVRFSGHNPDNARFVKVLNDALQEMRREKVLDVMFANFVNGGYDGS